jgi:hypothetical protein
MVDEFPGSVNLVLGRGLVRQFKDDDYTAQDVKDFLGLFGKEVALPFLRILDKVEPDRNLDVVVGVVDGECVCRAGECVTPGWFDGVVAG